MANGLSRGIPWPVAYPPNPLQHLALSKTMLPPNIDFRHGNDPLHQA